MWVSNDRASPPEVWEETTGLPSVCEGVTGSSLFTCEAVSSRCYWLTDLQREEVVTDGGRLASGLRDGQKTHTNTHRDDKIQITAQCSQSLAKVFTPIEFNIL
ncbi:hypothetical protein XENOCAPTIV_001654 [Xenoophorus captivus]|uniref:Uncharacterized protein n=1 Tax=Xenoophorus captivus TaxID=1517983 RepID=A0ABV0SCP8_9TELE